MSDRQLKLGAALLGVGGPGQHSTWLHPEIPGDASVSIDWYIDRARQLEEARFDFVFIVDSQFITPDSPPHYLNRLEPLTLLSALAVSTTSIGLVGTITTSYNAPFNVARRLASLDLISGGRAGWNVVTSGDAGTAGNYSGWHDFTQYDLDAPFPDVAAYGETSFRTQAEHIVEVARERGLTLRETVLYFDRMYRTPFAGSAETVANELERWFEGRAADGFILMVTVPSDLARFVDGVLPLLRERGIFRSEYESDTLRGNLGLPVPPNRHTAAREAESEAVMR
jgi:alkanesulfonate monooxygenase SsuD/methylene tetrahydromethanopterin reductase-like flavin-dependent oxidoreductase (luciferase family)